MTTPTPALPHRWRLWLILSLALLDVAALIAAQFGVADALLAGLRTPVEAALLGGLALLFPASADAILVELRRRDPRAPALPDDVLPGEITDRAGYERAKREGRIAEIDPLPPSSSLGLILVVLAASLSAATSGCSTGPQTVPQTTPINIACTWNNMDGGMSEDCDCLVDRATAGAEAATTGNVIRDNNISPSVDTDVSAIPSVP